MTKAFCTECGAEFSAAEKFCTQCGHSRNFDPVAPNSRDGDGPTNLPMPDGLPSINLTIYEGPARAEAISLINRLSSQQRKVWVLAGQPDILLWPGGDFPSWLGAISPEYYQEAKAAEANVGASASYPAYNAPRATNGIAVAGFVLSLVSVFTFYLVVPGILGLVFSISGVSRANTIEQANSVATGRGLAIAGLVISGLSLFATLVFWADVSTY